MDLLNLCFSCLIDGTGEHAPITLEDATYTLQCWKEEGNELAVETAGVTAEEFMNAWNYVFNSLQTSSKEHQNSKVLTPR